MAMDERGFAESGEVKENNVSRKASLGCPRGRH
jgi:hypothetical protein